MDAQITLAHIFALFLGVSSLWETLNGKSFQISSTKLTNQENLKSTWGIFTNPSILHVSGTLSEFNSDAQHMRERFSTQDDIQDDTQDDIQDDIQDKIQDDIQNDIENVIEEEIQVRSR